MATVQEWGKGSVWVGWQKFDTSQDAFKISQNISNKFLHAELSECVKKMCGYKGKNTLKMTKNYVKLWGCPHFWWGEGNQFEVA